MITEAIILGAIEAAIYRENDRWRAIRLAPSGKGTIDCTRSLALLMGSRAEQRALTEPLSNLKELETHLRDWSRRYRALNLLVAGMDSQLSDETRRTCIRAAEELLWDDDTNHFVRARLLGCPVPEEADIDGGIRLSHEIANRSNSHLFWSPSALDSGIHVGRTREGLEGSSGTGIRTPIWFYRKLQKVQTEIPVARRILDEVLFFTSGSEFNPEAARRAIIDAGVVADAALVLARKAGTKSLWQIVEDYSENPSLVAELENPQLILRQFISHIRDLIEQKFEKFLVEEKFSRDPELLTKFSDPEPVFRFAKFGIP